MPTITLYREVSYADTIREYLIVIDGYEVSSIKAGETSEISVAAGKHNIRLRADWANSNELQIEGSSESKIYLIGGSALREWRFHLVGLSMSMDKTLFVA